MGNKKIKVLVVEDSLVFRGLLVKYINADPDLEVVAGSLLKCRKFKKDVSLCAMY